jgi:hypothetical protein
LRSTFYYPNNMIIPISSASQGEQHPLYCIFDLSTHVLGCFGNRRHRW